MKRLGEDAQIFHEQISISSAATGMTLGYSMEDCESISFICGLGTVAAAAATSPTFTVRQSGDIGLSTSTTVGGATAIAGISTADQITNARSVLITLGTAATGAQTLVLNGYTLTFSTVGGATVATAMTFGSTEGSTVASGLANAGNSLSSVVNNSTLSYWMTASTPSTASVRLVAKDTASTGISAVTTASGAYALTLEKAHSQIDVLASDLNSTSKYVGVHISTVATAVTCGVTVIKHGLRYSPPYQSAQAYKKST